MYMFVLKANPFTQKLFKSEVHFHVIPFIPGSPIQLEENYHIFSTTGNYTFTQTFIQLQFHFYSLFLEEDKIS